MPLRYIGTRLYWPRGRSCYEIRVAAGCSASACHVNGMTVKVYNALYVVDCSSSSGKIKVGVACNCGLLLPEPPLLDILSFIRLRGCGLIAHVFRNNPVANDHTKEYPSISN